MTTLVRTFRILSVCLFLSLPFISRAVAQTQPEDFLASPPAPNASVYSSITSASTRSVISLNGTWQVSRNGGDTWENVQVPCSFSEQGNLLFRRSFQIPKELLATHRWKVVAYGVQYQGAISINGQFVRQHESGIPFSVNVPDEVKLAATNTIQVEVNNRLDYTSTVPLRKLLLGNRTYGGIFRDLLLVGVPNVWLDDVRFNGTVNGANSEAKFDVQVVSGTIRGMIARRSGDSSGSVTIPTDHADFELGVAIRRRGSNDTLPSVEVAHGAQTFSLDSKRTANVTLKVPVNNPELWGPGSPNLYDAVVQVRYQGAVVDEQVMRVGFRSITVKGSQLILNGEPLQVKGLVYVEDSKAFGASLPYDLMRRDVQTMRDMGVNVIRFADGTPHPYLLQLCDEMGILAFVDISIGTPPSTLFGDENYLKRSLDRVKFTAEESSHFTSVVAYGLSAQIPGESEKAITAVRRLRSRLDSIDNRLFYFSATTWTNPNLRKLTDIVGLNAFDADPALVRDMILQTKKAVNGEKPMVMLGYGKFVQLDNQNGYKDPISIEAQAKYISDIHSILLETDLAGGIYWSFNDYRTDRPILTANNQDQYLASCGIYGLGRELRQPGGPLLAALYTEQKAQDVAIGLYSPPSTILFIATGIACAVVFLLLINSSRRFRENVWRALLRPYNFYADIRDQRILSNVQTTILGLVISVTFAVILASICYFYRMDEGFDATLSAVITSDGLKELLNHVIWRPLLAEILFTVFFFGLMLIVALLIRVCAVTVRNKIFFSDAYIIAVWGALPVLILIIPGMVLYRALGEPHAGMVSFSVMLLVVCWMLYRVLRGTAVIYDVRPLKVYGYAIGTILAILIVVMVTSSETNATLGYLRDGISVLYSGR
ncbi:MAG: hypothetical protein JST22_17655 [Bacteroidetes bacterium]|nr:hypothetical protein [Bacteroidota bacterium]